MVNAGEKNRSDHSFSYEQHRSFDLLGFQPGLVHLTLGNLVGPLPLLRGQHSAAELNADTWCEYPTPAKNSVSRDPPAAASRVVGTVGMHHGTQLQLLVYRKVKCYYLFFKEEKLEFIVYNDWQIPYSFHKWV